MTRLLRSLAAIALAGLLAGCGGAELYSGLSERDANEMIAVLKTANVEADKSSRDGKTWVLTVPKNAFSRAVSVLQVRGYPKERFESLGDVFKKQGLVSTPIEEHSRLAYGLSQEMSNTVSAIDGVVWARVHISIPNDEDLSTAKTPSAAVLIKYDPEVDLSSQVASIKSLVAGSVDGLRYDRVTVILTPVRQDIRVAGPPSTYSSWWASAAAAALLIGGLGYWLSAALRSRARRVA